MSLRIVNMFTCFHREENKLNYNNDNNTDENKLNYNSAIIRIARPAILIIQTIKISFSNMKICRIHPKGHFMQFKGLKLSPTGRMKS